MAMKSRQGAFRGNAEMTEPDIYLLGRGKAEELRLKRQIADLAPLSDEQLAKVGIKAGREWSTSDAARAALFTCWESGSARPGRFLASTAALISLTWRANSPSISA